MPMTRSKTSVRRLAMLAQQISDAEAKLKALNRQLEKKNKEIKSNDEALEKQNEELRCKAVQLRHLDNDIQLILGIRKTQVNDENTTRPQRRTLDDGESITDLTIAHAEAKLNNLNAQIKHKDEQLRNKDVRLEEKNEELRIKFVQLAQLDQDIQQVLGIGILKIDDKEKPPAQKARIVFDDGSTITDLKTIMMTRAKTSAARMAELAKQISDAEAQLKMINVEIKKKDKVINSQDNEIKKKADEIHKMNNEIRQKTVHLERLDNRIRPSLIIGNIQPDDEFIVLDKSDITFDDWEPFTDWSGCESLED
ncbi:hypothetical protein EDC01DRAFT_781521 [Geopyxis carbonaria]|nr:hypothetical protein EDC01DRAFT_781521 [Geopyxis carbonaria]